MSLSVSDAAADSWRLESPRAWRRAPGLVVAACLLLGTTPARAHAAEGSAPGAPLLVAVGQVHTLAVSEIQRVAVGDPEVVDVTIVSPSQLLLQGKKVGATNLILWDAEGERHTAVHVVDPQPQAIEEQLTSVIAEQGFQGVEVHRRGDKVFVTGAVDEVTAQQIDQLVSAFPATVVNMVAARPPLPAPIVPEPIVSLAVQVLEISRTDLDKLGVKWSESIKLTESTMAASSLGDQLLRFGQAVQREGLVATLNMLVEHNRARLLSEPHLVTASGKEASSFIGVEVPILSATSVGTDSTSVSATIEFRKTGVLLKMTPVVLPDESLPRQIKTALRAEVSKLDSTVGLQVPVGTRTITVPGFKVREAETEVTVASGETIVIAGLLEAEDTDDVSQLPGLGNMPVLGRLFRSPEVQSTRRELVITVTPEIVTDAAATVDRQLALEQALAVAEVTASVDDPRLRYALQVQERIAKALRYPQREQELDIDGTVKLRLHLFADGTLGRAMVSESSGIESLDLEALKAAESQAPYPGFPSGIAERELWLEVPVIFRP